MNHKALIPVDIQRCFCPGGELGVKDGDRVVHPMNRVITFARRNGWLITPSRDWHPANSNHFKKWPVHGVQNTPGAEFHPDLDLGGAIIFSKGMGIDEDGYSAFDGIRHGGGTLDEVLTAWKVNEVYVGGLATDYCVKATVLDALRKGYKTILLVDAIRAVNLKPGDGEEAIQDMVSAGVILKTTDEVINENP